MMSIFGASFTPAYAAAKAGMCKFTPPARVAWQPTTSSQRHPAQLESLLISRGQCRPTRWRHAGWTNTDFAGFGVFPFGQGFRARGTGAFAGITIGGTTLFDQGTTPDQSSAQKPFSAPVLTIIQSGGADWMATGEAGFARICGVPKRCHVCSRKRRRAGTVVADAPNWNHRTDASRKTPALGRCTYSPRTQAPRRIKSMVPHAPSIRSGRSNRPRHQWSQTSCTIAKTQKPSLFG